MIRDTIGAIVDVAGGPIVIEPIDVDPPQAGEVQVRIVASGVCHSDLWARDNGNWGTPFPLLLGHEGAGIVEEIGDGVDGLRVGDPVVLSWAVPCGHCRSCLRGQSRRCGRTCGSRPSRRRTRRTGAMRPLPSRTT